MDNNITPLVQPSLMEGVRDILLQAEALRENMESSLLRSTMDDLFGGPNPYRKEMGR
jgi:hypothetical protein